MSDIFTQNPNPDPDGNLSPGAAALRDRDIRDEIADREATNSPEEGAEDEIDDDEAKASSTTLTSTDPGEMLIQAAQKKTKKGKVERELEAAPELEELAAEIIIEERLDVYPAKIGYFFVTPNLSKTMVGRIVTTSKELKFYSGKHYIIEISKEVWDVLDWPTRRVLLEHQLRHILILQNDSYGTFSFKLRKHDVQDFSKLIEKHGSDWIKRIRLCTSSIYGLTPREEDSVRI